MSHHTILQNLRQKLRHHRVLTLLVLALTFAALYNLRPATVSQPPIPASFQRPYILDSHEQSLLSTKSLHEILSRHLKNTKESTMCPKIFYLRTPKTGSSTLRQILANHQIHCEQRVFQFDRKKYGHHVTEQVLRDMKVKPGEYDVILNHVYYTENITRMIFKKNDVVYRLSSLRDPKERVLSFISYGDTKDSAMTSQLRYLSKTKDVDWVVDKDGRRVLKEGVELKEIVERVREDFSLIIVTDLFDVCMAILAHDMRMRPHDFLYMEINTNKVKRSYSEVFKTKGAEIMIKEDQELYEVVKKAVMARFASLPSIYKAIPQLISYTQEVVQNECNTQSEKKWFSSEDHLCMYRAKKKLFENVLEKYG